jgi:hypothetical protein
MKKLLTLVFAFVVAFALSMPVFAQEAPAEGQTQEAPATTGKKTHKKMHKKMVKKEKKAKKEKKEKKGEEAPPSGSPE